jgi:predicted metal-dependent hydrolase
MPAEVATHTSEKLRFRDQDIACKLSPSKTAKRLRIRVSRDSVEVVLPLTRSRADGLDFLKRHTAWVTDQLDRARRMASMRRPEHRPRGHILFRGQVTPVEVRRRSDWQAPTRVALDEGRITLTCGLEARTPTHRSLENWLRKQARAAIEQQVAALAKRLRRSYGSVYVMGQRTKWGNCSALGNLSFNWRLVMAPEYVLKYIVTHEMVHLAVPDHSPKFWLTVQSLFPETERARRWLVANSGQITIELQSALT